jgi:hypothetical protein
VYTGKLANWAATLRMTICKVARTDPHAFEVLPRRWVAERTFARISKHRRTCDESAGSLAGYYWRGGKQAQSSLDERDADPALQLSASTGTAGGLAGWARRACLAAGGLIQGITDALIGQGRDQVWVHEPALFP